MRHPVKRRVLDPLAQEPSIYVTGFPYETCKEVFSSSVISYLNQDSRYSNNRSIPVRGEMTVKCVVMTEI